MKIQLDTTNKTIKLDEDVKFADLIDVLKGILPGDKWKEFTLEVNTIIQNWSNPIIIEREKIVPYSPYFPPGAPIWMNNIEDDNKSYCLNEGSYNLSIE